MSQMFKLFDYFFTEKFIILSNFILSSMILLKNINDNKIKTLVLCQIEHLWIVKSITVSVLNSIRRHECLLIPFPIVSVLSEKNGLFYYYWIAQVGTFSLINDHIFFKRIKMIISGTLVHLKCTFFILNK